VCVHIVSHCNDEAQGCDQRSFNVSNAKNKVTRLQRLFAHNIRRSDLSNRAGVIYDWWQMQAYDIKVHTQVDRSTVSYAEFMWQTMLRLAADPSKISLTVHCMENGVAERVTQLLNVDVSSVPNVTGAPLGGSYGHGACVMNALASSNNGCINVIADSDTCMVAKGWDSYLKEKLIKGNVAIVGATYEDIGGFSSGSDKVQTYKKIPTLTWCALSPKHDWRSLNILPNKLHKVAIATDELSTIYNLPIGYVIFGEVGWQIPQYLHDNKLAYEGWRQLKPTKDAVVLKGLSDYHEEFHVDANVPFVVHHRGSLRHPYRGSEMSQRFYDAVDRYLQKELLMQPRWT